MSTDTPIVAVAIEYGMNEVPVVKAHGTGKLAEMIVDAARDAGVHIHKDEDLVGLLSLLELNEEIPENLYTVVAEVLAYSYWLKGMKPGDEKKADLNANR